MTSITLSTFLKDHAKADRRDSSQEPHHFLTLDRNLLACGQKIKETILKQGLIKAYDSKVHEVGQSDATLRTRLITVPNLDSTDPRALLDIATLLFYQKDRVNPDTFEDLDLFTQAPKPTFIATEVFMQIGGKLIPVAEYYCPYSHLEKSEEAVEAFTADTDTVVVRQMDKRLIPLCLDHVAQLFDQVVKSGAKPDILKPDLGQLAYIWEIANPYQLHNETIGDLVQKTLASLHSFQLQPPKTLRALSTPYYPDYLEQYTKDSEIK